MRTFPDTGGKWQIYNRGGAYPIWSRDGRELFFRSLDDRIMVSDVSLNGDSITPNRPPVWSEKRLADVGLIGSYDVAPDGKRVAALMPAEVQESQQSQRSSL